MTNISGISASISLILLHGGIPQGKVECKTITFDWVFPGIQSHVQTKLASPGVLLGTGTLGGIPSLKIIQD